MLVILPKRIFCECDSTSHSPQTLCSSALCRVEGVADCSTIHVKLIITPMTAIADFEQRWRQRGKKHWTAALTFKL